MPTLRENSKTSRSPDGPERRCTTLWRSADDFRFRSRWLQYSEYQESQESRSTKCRHRTDWKNTLVGVGKRGRENPARAGPSRGGYRNFEIKKVRIQQTRCEEFAVDANLWASLHLGIQRYENGSRANDPATAVHVASIDNRASCVEKMGYPPENDR